MREYIILFATYLIVYPLTLAISGNQTIAYGFHITALFLLLFYFWKGYKLEFKAEWLGIIGGVTVFLSWVALEGIYPYFYEIEYTPVSEASLILKLIGFILIAPFVEELFTRGFFIRFLVDQNWEKVRIGTYSLFSFVVSVLFFGLSHNRWLQGIIAGILFNIILYKTRRIESCIAAHISANALLAIFIVLTQNWNMW